jgi:hypothetical protein
MMNSSSTNDFVAIIAAIVLFTLFILVCALIARYFFRRLKRLETNRIISPKESKLIRTLFFTWMGLELPGILFIPLNQLFDYRSSELLFTLKSLFQYPLYFVINIIPVYIGCLLFYRKNINPVSRITPEGPADSLEDSVKKIFDSNEFYSAIATVLPKGEKDEDHGLDYIPFMLQNLQEKRKRFQRSSRNFLITIICLSIFFVSLTIFFSYILLNESSIGIYRDVKQLSENVRESDRSFSRLQRDMRDNRYFIEANGKAFENIQSFYRYNLNDGTETNLAFNAKEAVDVFFRDGKLTALSQQLRRIEDSIIRLPEYTESYVELLRSTNKSIDQFLNIRNKSLGDLDQTLNDVKELIPLIRNEIGKPGNTQNELLKRLILSAVVLTFFLAILRYFRTLYQNHYNEMLKAEHQELAIRKFYVAFKSAGDNAEERKVVLSGFLSDTDPYVPTDVGTRNRAPRSEKDMLKNIIDAIMKKL